MRVQRRGTGRSLIGCKVLAAILSASCLTTPAIAQTDEAAPAISESDQAIVVTARRRDEFLQSTPVSVSVLSGDDVANRNLRDFQDLRGVVSNLEVLPLASGGASITIRGIGQTSNQVNVDAKSGLYVNDMYVARQEGNELYFYDIGSLQVLKGPQGTLFGKNTTGGAMLLTTQLPGYDPGGYVKGRLGSYKRVDLEGAVNIPLTDTILTRFSFRTQNADGFVSHVLNDGDSNNINNRSARFQIRAVPSDRFTADLLMEYNGNRSDGRTSIAVGCRPDASYMRNYTALHSQTLCDAYPILNQGNTVYGGAYLTIPTSANVTDTAVGGDAGELSRGNRGPHNDTDVATVNLRLEYELSDSLSVKAITAYRYSEASFYNPTVNVPTDIYAELDNTDTTQFTHEVQLSGQFLQDRLNFVIGGFYSSQDTYFLQDTGPDWIDPLGYIYEGDNLFKSWAAYAQASFEITPELELTVGGRYTYDKKEASSYVFFAGNGGTYMLDGELMQCGWFIGDFLGGIQNCGGDPATGAASETWDSFDPRVQLSYQVTEDIFVYASYTKGYNAGGFNQQLGSSNPSGSLAPYDTEKLDSYEAGFKSSWLDNALVLNLTGFYQEYADIQTTTLPCLPLGAPNCILTRQVQSGASVEVKGIEGEVVVRPVDGFTLSADGAFLDQDYTEIRPEAEPFFPLGLATPVTSAPRYTYSIAGSYEHIFPSDAMLTFSANWRFVDKKPACNPIGSCYTPSYGLLGGRIDFTPGPDNPWTFSLWGTNILDEYVEISRNYGGGMGIDSYVPGRPAEFGVEIRRDF